MAKNGKMTDNRVMELADKCALYHIDSKVIPRLAALEAAMNHQPQIEKVEPMSNVSEPRAETVHETSGGGKYYIRFINGKQVNWFMRIYEPRVSPRYYSKIEMLKERWKNNELKRFTSEDCTDLLSSFAEEKANRVLENDKQKEAWQKGSIQYYYEDMLKRPHAVPLFHSAINRMMENENEE